jgi:ribonuclease VapC
MFLDASAVIGILNNEPGCNALAKLAESSPTPVVYSPLARFEAVIGLARNHAGVHRSTTANQIKEAEQLVDALYLELGASNMDLTDNIGTGALAAAQSYGRAVGHPADLNLGDCFAYACAKDAKVAIIYKGNDFSKTDLA